MSSDGRENFGAALSVMRSMGGLEAMVEGGTHISDLIDRVVLPPPNIDPISIRQVQEFATLLGYNPDGSRMDGRNNDTLYVQAVSDDPEPLVAPEVARDWLINQTHRATEREDGSIAFKKDEKPDHLGFAAMTIATGQEPRLFSYVYLEVTDEHGAIASEIVKDYARGMVRRFLAEE